MEFVYVVPRTALFPSFYPQGFVAFADETASQGVSSAHVDAVIEDDGFFVERAYAERTPSLKQPIPYSIIVCGDDSDARILLTRRLKRGGETRLHDKLSIGIGGHVNPQDVPQDCGAPARGSNGRNPLHACTQREIAEELESVGPFTVHRVGILNDDSNPVGAVHVGVVQVVRTDDPVEVRERDQLEGRLVTIQELQQLQAKGANFETWSQLLITHLDELLPYPANISAPHHLTRSTRG